MALNKSQKVLVTGATGYLGAHVTRTLLKQTQATIIGTSTQVEWKGAKLRQTFEEDESMDGHYDIDRLDLVECDMLQDEECYYKAVMETKPDYVIHTAAPFMTDVVSSDQESVKRV